MFCPEFRFEDLQYFFLSDLDECRMKNSTLCTCANGKSDCGAFCTNTKGGFKCSCGSGYKLLGSTKCVGML